MGERGIGFAAEHPGDFFDPGFAFDFGKLGNGAVGGVLLGDDELGGGGGSDLGEVGNAEDLVGGAEAAHLCADGMGDFAADVCVDLIENEEGDAVLCGEGAFHGEHYARNLAAGGDELEGFCGLAGIWGEEEFCGFEAGGGRLIRGTKGDCEFGFLEAEVVQLFLDIGSEPGSGRGAELRELRTERVEGFAGDGDFALQALEFLAAGLDFAQTVGGLFAEGDDIGDGGTVFALEGFEEGDAFLEFRELLRVDIEGVHVMLEGADGLFQFDDGIRVGLGEGRGGGIEFLQLTKMALDLGETGEQGVVSLREALEDGGGELDEAAAVCCDGVPGEDGLLLAGLDAGGVDLIHLMTEEVDLALEGGLAGGELGMADQQGVERGVLRGVCGASGGGAGEVVEEVELPIVREERLVIVRAVEVDEEIAEGAEDGEGGGGGVGELAIGAGGGEGALEDEGAVLAGLGAVFLEAGVHGGGVVELEDGLDRA